jgi:hypothetical protein
MLLAESAKATTKTDSLFNVLRTEIGRKPYYDQTKERVIKNLKQQLAEARSHGSLADQYALCKSLSRNYRVVVFDSAYVYMQRQLQLSSLMHDLRKQYEVEISLGEIQLARGMFKETFEYLRQIKVGLLSDSTKQQFYKLKSFAYNNLALYNIDANSPTDQATSNRALDSAIALAKPGTFEEGINLSNRQTTLGFPGRAIKLYRKLLTNPTVTIHQRAMIAYNISGLSSGQEKIHWLMISAIYDIQSSTNETLAAFDLGKIFAETGKLNNAELLLNLALDQSRHYGNRKQESEVIAVLKIVAAQKVIDSENKKNSFLRFLIIIFALAIISLAYISFLVRSRLKRIKIREAAVQQRNSQLDNLNKKLLEDARIKEAYIGYFFNIISGNILKLEKVKRIIMRNSKTQDYEEILKLAREIDIREERENLFHTFDNIFLKLFPQFIITFNSMLKPEDQIWPKDNEVLNTSLRIFALIRLGIKDNQVIANILETALTTVYTYKTRIRAKAIVPADEFENLLMEVKFSEIN